MILRFTASSGIALLALLAGCGSDDDKGGTGGANSASGGVSSGGATSTTGGVAVSSGGTATGSGGVASTTGGVATTTGGMATATGGVGGALGPSACADAAKPYSLSNQALDAALVPVINSGGWGAPRAQLPLAVDPATNRLYVGFTSKSGTSFTANLIAEDAAASAVVSVPDAIGAGIAVTSNGFGMLLYEPVAENQRKWVAVARLGADGKPLYTTDLFRSANLTDANTKGEPNTSRLAYLQQGDQLLAYFEHSELIQGTRHFGGYLALVNAEGKQTLLNGWFGSHNLDQRVLVDGPKAAVLGLGDAFPKGIIFSSFAATDKPRANAIYPLAANGVGTTNGQLGGIQNAGDAYLIPFVTNRTLAQDFDAGAWPDTDEAKSKQIVDAAAKGTELGLLSMSKTGAAPTGGLTATWLEAQRGKELGEETSITQLKSARYGNGYYLLAWKETGTVTKSKTALFTLVIDKTGAVCQPKTQLPVEAEFMPGDDFVTRPDGRISWANYRGNQLHVVTLTP